MKFSTYHDAARKVEELNEKAGFEKYWVSYLCEQWTLEHNNCTKTIIRSEDGKFSLTTKYLKDNKYRTLTSYISKAEAKELLTA